MEALSLEDGGRGVCFSVYVYNVQPGVIIDYATGESRPEGEASAGEAEADPAAFTYILNTRSMKFHDPGCSGAADTKAENRQLYTGSREELMALYHRADLLVFPSIYDNAPMVLREAAAMGTPGLVVKGSCSAEGVKDGENGFICEDEGGESIARAIVRALPDATRVGLRAQETIPIRWESIMTRVVAEYERLRAVKGAGR